MDDLPLELLENIFIWLYQEEKVKCMTVCRNWEKIIESSCLFHTIELCTIDGFHKVIQKLQQNSSHGLQVQCMVLDLDLFHSFDINFISSLCPNLKLFYRATINTRHVPQQMQTVEFQSWNSHLEHIYELQGDPLSLHLLASKKCPYLKTLTITDVNNSNVDRFHMLSNAPNLTKLTINRFMISIESLELFHDILPCLMSITFLDSEFKEISVPKDIKPANRIKIVLFELSGDSIGDKTKLLQYANKKYPDIEDFSYIDFDDYKDIPDSEKDEVNSFLQEGLVPLLSRAGSQIRKLTISFDLFDLEHLKALSTTQCQIESFSINSLYKENILENLTDISQFSCLQSLRIRGIQPSNFRWLKKLSSLKSLKLRNRNKRFCDLEDIIRMCNNTVESITLRGAWIQPKLTSTTCFVRNLTIAFANFGSKDVTDVDHFISHSCPRLKILKLHRCIFPKEFLDFSRLDLSYFELIQYDARKVKYILVRTEDDKQGHWYFVNHTSHHLKSLHKFFSPQESRVFPPTKSLPYEQLIDVPHYTFSFASVKNVSIKDK